MKIEIKPIAGYEGRYSVTDGGAVYSHLTERYLIGQRVNGYRRVVLYKAGFQPKRMLIHRAVCFAFNGHPLPGRDVVNHKDGNRSNNAKENLEWCSTMENVHASISSGRMSNVGELNGRAKISSSDATIIRKRLVAGEPLKSVCASFGISAGLASKIKHKKLWKHAA